MIRLGGLLGVKYILRKDDTVIRSQLIISAVDQVEQSLQESVDDMQGVAAQVLGVVIRHLTTAENSFTNEDIENCWCTVMRCIRPMESSIQV